MLVRFLRSWRSRPARRSNSSGRWKANTIRLRGAGVEQARELGEGAGGFVVEGYGQVISGHARGQAGDGPGGLALGSGERAVLRGLGLYAADHLAGGVEQVVGLAHVGAGEFADGHAEPGVDVHVLAALDDPAVAGELGVDGLPSLDFGRHRASLVHNREQG